MTAGQPIQCPTCQGVIVSMRASSYTVERARLIVTHGYCLGWCPAPETRPVERPDAALVAHRQ
ncbi:hypothetical protein [Nonomuraea sp. NPDC002799]